MEASRGNSGVAGTAHSLLGEKAHYIYVYICLNALLSHLAVILLMTCVEQNLRIQPLLSLLCVSSLGQSFESSSYAGLNQCLSLVIYGA